MPHRRSDPPRLESERVLRLTTGVPLLLVICSAAVSLPAVVSTRSELAPPPFPWLIVVLFVTALAVAVRQWLRLTAWRRAALRSGERLLWGTSAARVLPTGGAPHGGLVALTDLELRYAPDVDARLRGTRPESWPIGSIAAVRVAPVDERRRRHGGRWVVVDLDDGPALTLVTPEPRLVADELSDALHAQGLLPRDVTRDHV